MCSRKSLGFRKGCHDDRYLFEAVWSRSHPLELKEGKLAEHQASDVLGAVQMNRCILFRG